MISPVGVVVGVKELKSCREWQLFHNFLKAPTSYFDKPINVNGEPVGAI
tara:strand:+ start:31 stop:177 length:147 start_codon:yes stop_codon:yes gene_type:complete